MALREPSRTTVPQTEPLTFHPGRFDAAPSPVVAELRGACEGSSQGETEMRLAEVHDRLQLACLGQLTQPDELEEVHLDPELWEIRWQMTDRCVRLYHAEPAHFPRYLVGLHAHVKVVSGSEDVIKSEQNAEIGIAALRHARGRPIRWGIS